MSVAQAEKDLAAAGFDVEPNTTVSPASPPATPAGTTTVAAAPKALPERINRRVTTCQRLEGEV